MTQHVRKGRQAKARRQQTAAYWKAFEDAWDVGPLLQLKYQEQMEAMAKQYENYQYTPYIKPELEVSG